MQITQNYLYTSKTLSVLHRYIHRDKSMKQDYTFFNATNFKIDIISLSLSFRQVKNMKPVKNCWEALTMTSGDIASALSVGPNIHPGEGSIRSSGSYDVTTALMDAELGGWLYSRGGRYE